MKARAFNSILIDSKNKLFTKTSHNVEKLKNEVNYYLNLPPQVAHLFPKLIDYSLDYTSYTLEYIPYKSLSDLILANEISVEEAEAVLNSLFEVLDDIHAYKPASSPSIMNIKDFYVKKTIERIEKLKNMPAFQEMLGVSQLNINNKSYQTFQKLEADFIKSIQNFITKQPATTMIHGDFCFSNILYCAQSKDIKLIDPRGSFGTSGIYGHPDYDYAKLLHCLHGGYDYIVNDNYEFRELNKKSFSFKWPSSSLLKRLQKYFHTLLQKRGISLEFSYLIEASLFLSMAPLHYECRKRQKALFLMGIIILNNFFEGNYENLH